MPPKSVKSKSADSEVKSKSIKSTKSKDSVSIEDLEKPTEKQPTKTTKKVVKKEPVKEQSESEHSESEHSESEHSESKHSESEHSESDNDVIEEKDKQDKQDWNAQLSDDEPQNELKVTKRATHNLDRPQYKSKRFNNNKFERKPNVNKLSKALKFSYNDYEHVANPVHEVSSEDLLRVVVARSYKEGQMSLKRCLETVLRAMNHECNFPSLPKHNNFHNSEKQEKQEKQVTQ